MENKHAPATNSSSTPPSPNTNDIECYDYFARFAKVPPHFAGQDGRERATLHNFFNPERASAKAAAVEALTLGRWIILTGKQGRGKTHLAIALAWHYWQHLMPKPGGIHILAKRPRFVCVPELLASLQEGFGGFDQSGHERQLLDPLFKSEFLILDELQDGLKTEWSQGVVFRIVNKAYNNGHKLIVTSNADIKELASASAYPRIPDRLAEMGDIINLGGPSERLILAQKAALDKRLESSRSKQRPNDRVDGSI